MKIKKYVARNMPEALQQVREDLGEKAVILNTRQIRRNHRFNPHGETRVEVTAAFDDAASPSPLAAARSQAAPLAAQKYAMHASAEPPPPVEPQLPAEPPPEPQRRLPPASDPQVEPPGGLRRQDVEEMVGRLRHLQDAVAQLEQRGRAQVVLPEELERLASRMHSMGLAEALVGQVVQQLFQEVDGEALNERRQVGERAGALLVELLPVCKDVIKIGPRRKVIGFIGSSGSGKTTAAAKIAAGFAMKRKHRVVLVTADDKRVGALDQARAFAEIIGVPLEVAYTPEEIEAVLEKHAAAQLVLIDTAGCGPHDHQAWEHQRRLLEAAGVDGVQVVIDSLTSFDHMLDVIEACEGFPERRLLFTKMDEAVRSGAVLSAVARSQIPVSYLVVGPAVPGAIEAGNLAKLTGKMVGITAVSQKRRD